MIRLIELFSGIGSQASALERLGIPFKTVAVCEIDKTAHDVYEALHGKTLNLGDITKVDKLPEYDLLTYSFPCQDLSRAGECRGMAEGSGTRSSLLWEVGRLLKGHKPEWLLMENVPMIISKNNITDFNKWIKRLSDMGYNSKYKILNAVDFGIPQNRQRCFMVSRLNGVVPDLPTGREKRRKLSEFLEDADEKYYLTDKETEGLKPYNSVNNSICKKVGDLGYVYESESRVYCTDAAIPTIRTAPKSKILIKNGTKKGYLEAHPGDGIDLNRVSCNNRRGHVQVERVPPLMTASNTGVLMDDCRIRRLTPRESWRLMGFTDEQFDKVEVSDAQLYKLAGNSIVVNVLMEIFKSMFNVKNGQSSLEGWIKE